VLDRALAFTWAVAETIADDVVEVAPGTVLSTPSLPAAWSANCLRVEGPHPGLTLADAEALCAARLPDVGYRHVRVEHEATAERLASSARAEGWRVDREVVMVLEGPAGPPAGGGPVREGTLEEVLELTDAWYVEEGEATSDEVGANLREMTRREHAATPERRFIVEDPPGRPAGMTSIRERDRVCMLEDVYVLPDVRGRGHGRALVRHATDFARRDDHDVVFLVADADGWPQRLYASAGFVPAGTRATLHRDV
jgi:GNAT superfamily N-acetyltransferase